MILLAVFMFRLNVHLDDFELIVGNRNLKSK